MGARRARPPRARGDAGRESDGHRAFVEAVRWKAHTLRPWRDLPAEYGRWNTAAVRVKRWAEGGHWARVCKRVGDRVLARFVSQYD